MNSNVLLQKKRKQIKEFILPKPSFKKQIADFSVGNEENRRNSFESTEKQVSENQIENTKVDPLAPYLKKEQNFIFVFEKKPLGFSFEIEFNFLGTTVLEIKKFVEESEINLLSLSCKDIKLVVKLICKRYPNFLFGGNDRNSFFMNKIGIIKDNNSNFLYFVFHNINQFKFSAEIKNENEFLIYQIHDEEKCRLILNEKNDDEILKKKIDQIVDPYQIKLKDFAGKYRELKNLSVLVPSEKQNHEKRLKEKEKEKILTSEKYNSDIFSKDLQYQSFEIEKQEKENNELYEELLMIEKENLNLKMILQEKLEQLDDEMKLTESKSSMITNKKENISQLKKNIGEVTRDIEFTSKRLKEVSLEHFQEEQKIKNSVEEVITIDGFEFEVPTKSCDPGVDQEEKLQKELISLQDEVENYSCMVCYERRREFLYMECNHICSCLECFYKGNKIKDKRTKHGVLDGEFRCPYCKTINTKIIKINFD